MICAKNIGMILLACCLAEPALAQDGSYRTALDVTFGYSGGKTDEPLVAIGGVPSANFAYRADSTERRLDVVATRFFPRVPDDGITPFALLASVAHPSFVSARVGLSQTSRDSAGFSIGGVSTLDARLAGDLGRSVGELRGSYSLDAIEVTGTVAALASRETAATTSTELPSGRASFGSFGTRTSETDALLGTIVHFGPEASLGLEGTLRDADTRRSERSVFSGGGGLAQELRLAGRSLGFVVSGRKLVLARRLAFDVSYSYEVTKADLDSVDPPTGALDAGRFIARRLAASADFFVDRVLDFTLGGSYRTASDLSGLPVQRRNAAHRSVAVSGAARWFVRPRASVSLSISRTRSETISPPESETFQKLVETVDRVDLTGSLRF